MANNYIIGRTERVRELKALLQQKRAVYLSAFFYAGKTVLLDQLAKALEGTVLRFDMGRDDWTAFQNQVQRTPDCTLLIDSLHQLCATNVITVLDKDFVLFDEEEIIQLFLEYGTAIKPEDAAWLKQNTWGWPVPLHITAQRLQRDPSRDIREIRTEAVKELERLLIQDVVAAFASFFIVAGTSREAVSIVLRLCSRLFSLFFLNWACVVNGADVADSRSRADIQYLCTGVFQTLCAISIRKARQACAS